MPKLYSLSLIINIVTIALVLITIRALPPVVPLYYGRAISESQLAPSIMLLTPPITAIVLGLLNLVLARFVIRREFLKDLLIYTSVFISVLSAITVVKIVFLVANF